MKRNHNRFGHAGRIESGETLLAAARFADTSLVVAKLADFQSNQQAYADTQRALDIARREEQAANSAVASLVADADDALEVLVARLIGDGQPRNAPLEGYGTHIPSTLKSLRLRDKSVAYGKLAGAVRADTTRSAACHEAADRLDAMATAMMDAVLRIAPLESRVRDALTARDAAAASWYEVLARLRRAVRAAEDDGATGLDEALFGHMTKKTGRKAKPSNAPDDESVQAA